jgi:hypothetical protein
MRQFRIDDSEKDRILNLHESATKRQYLSEQTEMVNINKAIQCFLNKKGIKDDEGKTLVVDGLIGRLEDGSKSAQAISEYQGKVGVKPDGVWGFDTASAMTNEDKEIMKDCRSEHGDLLDKFLHLIGLD